MLTYHLVNDVAGDKAQHEEDYHGGHKQGGDNQE